MTKNIALLQGHDLAMEEMEVRTTDGSAGHLQDDVIWIGNVGYRRINDAYVLPDQLARIINQDDVYTHLYQTKLVLSLYGLPVHVCIRE
jgi:hypothetical protein